MNGLRFEVALSALRSGEQVGRDAWHGDVLTLMRPPAFSIPAAPPLRFSAGPPTAEDDAPRVRQVVLPFFITRDHRGGPAEVWSPAQADLFAVDWYVLGARR